jgi:predicted CopG family antitoxin
MKTITLTDEAYVRLLAWKENQKDSFSKVVDRLVPRRGTLGAVLTVLHDLPPIPEGTVDHIAKEALSNRDWKDQEDPWTT